MRIHPHQTLSSRAFALNGWIMFLFVLLVGVCIGNAVVVWQSMPAATNAYSAGTRVGVWLAPVIGPLVLLAIAWGVGKLVSLMFGKSDDAGNIGAAVILLGALSLYAYGIYFRINAPPPAAIAANSSMAASPRSAINSAPSQLQPQASRGTPASSVPETPASQPPRPPQADAAANQASEPDPTPALPARAPAKPMVAPPAENAAVRPTIDAFVAELTPKIDALSARAEKMLPDLARQPPHDLTKIKSRRSDAESLKADAVALKATLDATSDQLTAKLETAGVPASDARSAAFRWSGFEFKTASRSFGADALIRLADKAIEQCDALMDNFGKWTLDSKGEIKCSDFQIKSKLRSLHFFVNAEADRKQQIMDQLDGH